MNVNIDLVIEVRWQPDLIGSRAHIGHRGLRAFLHHVAELTGDGELATAGDNRDFDLEQLAAHLGPRGAGCDANLWLDVCDSVAEAGRSEELRHARTSDLHMGVAIGLDDLDR